MSRRTARKRAAQPERPRGSAPRRIASLLGIAALFAAGGVLSWWLGSPPRESHPTKPVVDPLLAIQEGLALGQQGRFVESLPLLKAAVESSPISSTGHHDYATAILNAVHQGRHHLGKDEFAIRSSVERVALVREALEELVQAERLAGNDPHARAWAKRTQAQAMGAWGFPWEAFAAYRQAEWTDPSWKDIDGRADHVMDELEHPERARERSAE